MINQQKEANILPCGASVIMEGGMPDKIILPVIPTSTKQEYDLARKIQSEALSHLGFDLIIETEEYFVWTKGLERNISVCFDRRCDDDKDDIFVAIELDKNNE